MKIYLFGALWVLLAGGVCGGVAFYLRRRSEREGRAENNESAGQVFTIVGGLHAVLVAFVLIGLFDSVDTAKDNSFQEADSLVAVTWAGDSLPAPQSDQIKALAVDYANAVVNDEWPKMMQGQDVGDTAVEKLNEMKSVIASAPASSGFQTDQKEDAANQLWNVYQDRQTRINEASEGVSAVIWFALAVGSLLTVALAMLFGGPKEHAHVLIIASLAGTLTLLIFAIYQLQNPFAGGASVSPEAFRTALDRLG